MLEVSLSFSVLYPVQMERHGVEEEGRVGLGRRAPKND